MKKSASAGLLGIEINSEGVAVAHINRLDTGLPILQSCRFLPREQDQTLPLAQYIRELGLKGTVCNLVLPSSSYNLFLSEAPNVEDAELADAMRWKVKDLIDFPVEEAALDVFRLPKDASRTMAQMVYVVISRRAYIDEIIQQLAPVGLRVESIDIVELALRNLSLLCPDDPNGVAMVQITPGMGNLNIVRGAQLYVCRRFDIDFEGGFLEPLPVNSLALELQRSLDYYEHQMGQVPPSQVYLCGEGVSDDKISAELKASLEIDLKALPLGQLMVLPDGCDEMMLTNCIGAIGAALRDRNSL